MEQSDYKFLIKLFQFFIK